MKKLMILGAGYTQIPLIAAAKRMGCYTITASIDGDYPGFLAADEAAYVDIADPRAVAEKAAKLQVDGVTTCGLDLGMAAIGAACEALSLPGPSAEAARKASNKLEMKKALSAAGVQTARFVCIHNKEELQRAMEQLPFPVILKAVDQMGSRGIFRCNTREEVWENYSKTMEATKKDYCLLEEFIEGEIFGVEAMIQQGEVVYMLPNNIEAFQSTTPTPVGHSVPFRELDSLGTQIREQTEKAIHALGLDNCPVNCDFIKKDGNVYVIELTGRSGATGLSEMVGIYYDIDYYEMIVRIALGQPVKPYFSDQKCGVPNLTHTLMSERTGIVRRIHNYNRSSEEIVDLSFNIEPGDLVHPYTNGRDRLGQVILKGTSLEACERKLREVLSHIRLELEGDIPLYETVIHPVDDRAGNQCYVKREDMLPFSFGGNKVRFAQYYLEDMERQSCNGMIIYGNYHSNLCRILAAACRRKGIPCNMVHNVDDADPKQKSSNSYLIKSMGVKEFPCHKSGIAEAVKAAWEDLRQRGFNPYYIYGNCFGQGNEWIPMQAYADVYQEILAYEEREKLHFDYLFLASSTNMTQSGLLLGHLLAGDTRKIIGISVSRQEARAREVIAENLQSYSEKHQILLPSGYETEIELTDAYLDGGYGNCGEKIQSVMREAYEKDGLNLDGVYTGKAFYGMQEYLKAHGIQGKKVLFIHTGGAPLFFDRLPTLYPDVSDEGRNTCESVEK